MPFGSGGAGTLGSLGMIMMPVAIVVMMLKQPPGPVAKLIRSGATSPETARRLGGVGIPRAYVVEPAVRQGRIVRTDDGRYWVDLRVNRRFRRKVAILAGLLGLLVAGGVAWGVGEVLGHAS